MAVTNLGTNSLAANKSQPQSAHLLLSRPPMCHMCWQALMFCQITAQISHRSPDNPYILLQLVKFSPRRQIIHLCPNVTHCLKYSIQLPVLVLHKHAKMVDCFCDFIHTTSLAQSRVATQSDHLQ